MTPEEQWAAGEDAYAALDDVRVLYLTARELRRHRQGHLERMYGELADLTERVRVARTEFVEAIATDEEAAALLGYREAA